MRILSAALAAALALGAAAPASAQFGEREITRIRTAIEAGRIVPLRQLLEAVDPEQSLYILEAELDEDSDAPSGWLYEVELLTEEGERELEIDARSGEILEDD